jgi:hypothetical protein
VPLVFWSMGDVPVRIDGYTPPPNEQVTVDSGRIGSEIGRIRQRVHGRAALIGLGVGAAAGAVYGAASWSPSEPLHSQTLTVAPS